VKLVKISGHNAASASAVWKLDLFRIATLVGGWESKEIGMHLFCYLIN
jgi:hypothetical protein